MKMNKFCFFIAIAMLCSATFSGCSEIEKEQIITSDMIEYHTTGYSDFGFNIDLITNESSPSVDIIDIDGKNTDNLVIKYQDDTFEEIKDIEIEDRYFTIMGFVCHTDEDMVQIDSMTLDINGEETFVEFETPIIHKVKKDMETPMFSVFFPVATSSSSIGEQEYPFIYCTNEKVEITDFGFNDFLYPKDVYVLVNNEKIGNLDSVLPLELNVDDTLEIRCIPTFINDKNYSNYSTVVYDVILKYRTSESDYINCDSLLSQGVSNFENAVSIIKLLDKKS